MTEEEFEEDIEGEERREQIAEARENYSADIEGTAPIPEEKMNVHTFLTKVVETEDTTRLGYLTEEELGVPKLPLRTQKELQLFCDDIADMPYFGSYFGKEGEILTSTSLSKNAKLLDLAVVQRREIKSVKPARKPNKGWFKKKNKMVSQYGED